MQKIARSTLLVPLALLAGAATVTTASAQERARVLSATPIVQQMEVPQQMCDNQTVYTGQQTTGGGAVLGAVAGGAVGNAIGGGSGRAAATALGLIGGALLGNQIEGNGKPQYQNVQRCYTQTYYENRTVGYTVVYEYAGRQYTTQTPNDPGRTIEVQIQAIDNGPADAYGLTYSPVEPRSYPDEPYQQQYQQQQQQYQQPYQQGYQQPYPQQYQQPYQNSPRYVSPAVIVDDSSYRSGPRQSWR